MKLDMDTTNINAHFIKELNEHFRLCNFKNSETKTLERTLLMYSRKQKCEQTYSPIAISTINFTIRTYKGMSEQG